MQHHSRQAILSAALKLPPGREPTRDTVEAAIWAAVGFRSDEFRVGSLMAVIDAYADARARQAAYHWAQRTGGELPPTSIDIAQSISVRRSLDSLAQLSQPRSPRIDATSAIQQPQPAAAARQPYLTIVSGGDMQVSESMVDDDARKEARVSPGVAAPPPSATLPVTPAAAAEANDTAVEELSICRGCGREMALNSDNFYRATTSARGFASTCKKCQGRKNKAYRDGKKKDRERQAANGGEPAGGSDDHAELMALQ